MEAEARVTYAPNPNFMCGVVEGFYGRPWTSEQRKDLFQKMNKWGLDSYLYAPKDDYKHRAFWRELYTVEETDHLGSLIAVAKENDISFIYAISPGLDIIYSGSKDVTALKRKLEQVSQLGCNAFAILFDDIDAEMSKADKEIFKSFAHAQVSVTNEIFQFLNPAKFLFCPTQYCASRAFPNVRGSEYLNTLGEKLDNRIDVMWTGAKVITKDISIESIEELTDVIRRPPVIWDNLHANDYDQKRIYLGPYCGRSPQLVQRLRGVLTNPNCEYGANFVAIHTLAQWSRCNEDAQKKIDELMNADAKLETENDERDRIPDNLSPHVYHPVVALQNALKEWILEFKKIKDVWGPIVKPQILTVPVPLLPSVNTCIAVTSTTTTQTVTTTSATSGGNPPADMPTFPTVNCSARVVSAIVENGSASAPPLSSNPVMNSLAADNKIICTTDPILTGGISDNHHIRNLNSLTGLEPMDTVSTPPSPLDKMSEGATDGLNKSSSEDVLMLDRTANDSHDDLNNASGMALDNESDPGTTSLRQASSAASSTMQGEDVDLEKSLGDEEESLSVEDLQLLCDLFYLPFEHGPQGLQILTEFQWLKTNCSVVAGISSRDKTKPEVIEWFERSTKFQALNKSLTSLMNKLNMAANRELLYELYPYIWDMRGVVSLMNSYIEWLAFGQIPSTVTTYVHGSYTWFSKGWREAFCSGEQEPWVIRGGLTSELQRLIPVDRGTDLYVYKAPEIPSSRIYTIRNYRPSDEAGVYKVITMTFKDGLSAAEEFMNLEKFPGDLKVGGFLNNNADLSFVVEDENEVIVGVAVGAYNGKEFRRRLNKSWLPNLRALYSDPPYNGLEYGQRMLASIQSDLPEVPEDLLTAHPAELRVALLTPLVDPSVPKRLMTCVLAAFRANGIFGCFIEATPGDKFTVEFYKKLGFVELPHPNFLGRAF